MMLRPCALIVATLLVCATAAHAQNNDDDVTAIDDIPHVTIVGSASAEVVPDIAEISVAVHTEKPSAAEASTENARAAQALIDAAKAQGIEAKDIRTQAVTLSQVYDEVHDANGRFTGRKPRGFAASNTILVRMRTLDKVGSLAQSLVEKGANQLNGISFFVEKPEPVMDRLLADAVRDARHKASIAADGLGIRLGQVLLIEHPPQSDGSGMPMKHMMVRATAAPAVPLEAGTQTLRAEMQVTWALQP